MRARAAYWTVAVGSQPFGLRDEDDEALESRSCRKRDRPSVLASDASPAGLRDLEQPSALFVPDLH